MISPGFDAAGSLTFDIALLYWDYLLTLPDEIKHIWKKKFRVTTLLYMGCRFGLLTNIIYLFALANKLPMVSRPLEILLRAPDGNT